eukprot:PITA_23437
MPFGLINAGATFQRAMDIAFVGEKDKFVLIYLDDITVFSSSHKDHLQHLKKVFLKCRQFGISVNLKKSQFSLEECKLLGHIVCTEGVKIDPTRVQVIHILSIQGGERIEEVAKEQEQNQSLAENLATCEWYSSVVHFLQKLEVPPRHSSSQPRAIKLRLAKLCINKNLLYWRDPSGILLRCLDKGQSVEVRHQFHSSIYGGHHYWKTTAHKILRAGYY